MARTEQKSERRRSGRLVGAAEISGPCKMAQASAEKNWVCRKGWPQRHKESTGQGRLSLFCQKEKEQSH